MHTKSILAGLGALALIGGLVACGTAQAPAAAPAPIVHVTQTVTAVPTPTVTAKPTPTVTKTVAPVPTRTVYVAPAPAGPSGVNCGADQNGYSVYAGANTSCPFALNVAASYNGAAYDAGPQVITVYSPVTGLNYSMTYTWTNGFITATGANDASVQFTG